MNTRARSALIPCATLALLWGCSTAGSEPLDVPVDQKTDDSSVDRSGGDITIGPEDQLGSGGADPSTQVPGSWTTIQRDLSALLPADTLLVGVTRDPLDGAVYLLDANVGIYRLTEESADLVFEIGSITPDEHPPEGAFTDIAAMGFNRFALTAPNDGFILDLDAGTMWRHFCYLPPSNPSGANLPNDTSLSVALQEAGTAVWQRTDSVAYDTFTGTIVAQPQTLAVEDNEVFGAEMATFDELSGEPLSWTELPETSLRAGGLAVTETQFLLGEGNVLHVYDRQSAWEIYEQTLDVGEISGMHGGDFDDILLVTRTERVLYRLNWTVTR